jgi:hypothetical protein
MIYTKYRACVFVLLFHLVTGISDVSSSIIRLKRKNQIIDLYLPHPFFTHAVNIWGCKSHFWSPSYKCFTEQSSSVLGTKMEWSVRPAHSLKEHVVNVLRGGTHKQGCRTGC